jgi:hypothetical protein
MLFAQVLNRIRFQDNEVDGKTWHKSLFFAKCMEIEKQTRDQSDVVLPKSDFSKPSTDASARNVLSSVRSADGDDWRRPNQLFSSSPRDATTIIVCQSPCSTDDSSMRSSLEGDRPRTDLYCPTISPTGSTLSIWIDTSSLSDSRPKLDHHRPQWLYVWNESKNPSIFWNPVQNQDQALPQVLHNSLAVHTPVIQNWSKLWLYWEYHRRMTRSDIATFHQIAQITICETCINSIERLRTLIFGCKKVEQWR